MTPNIENNPLNTGNGAPQGSNPVTPVTAQASPTAPKPAAVAPAPVPPTAPTPAPVAPASMPPTASTPATPTTPAPPTQKQAAAATTAQASAESIVSGTSKILQFKKYIIAGIVGIIFLTIIYVAYSFFSSPSDEVATEENPTTEVELNNSLSGSSSTDSESTNPEDTAELEKVVNDLKDQYKDDNSNPPGISIVIPETTTETETPTPAGTDTAPPADSKDDPTPPIDSKGDSTPPADSEEVAR